jgi:hypothetical protein
LERFQPTRHEVKVGSESIDSDPTFTSCLVG